MGVRADRLSSRMEALIALVPRCECLADIGCDHGYISIAVAERGLAERVIACDVNEGPLKAADTHIREAGLSDRIDKRLGDGLERIEPREADVILISGMGGRLITRILTEGSSAAKAAASLVLGPQSEVAELRRYLVSEGYYIDDEDMVLEDGKYYPLMRVKRPKNHSVEGGINKQSKQCYNDVELRFGPVLIRKKHPILLQYLQGQQVILERNLRSIEDAGADKDRAKSIRAELKDIGELVKEMS